MSRGEESVGKEVGVRPADMNRDVPNPARASARIRTWSKLSEAPHVQQLWRPRDGANCGAGIRDLERDWTAVAS